MSMDLAKTLYAKMPDVFAKARKKFGRGLTLAEKILCLACRQFRYADVGARQGDVGAAA